MKNKANGTEENITEGNEREKGNTKNETKTRQKQNQKQEYHKQRKQRGNDKKSVKRE